MSWSIVHCAGALSARIEGPVFWCLAYRDLFAPALHLAGLHPDRVIHVEAGSDAKVLLAMEECLRHAGLAGVVGEIAKYSTTASKRLQLRILLDEMPSSRRLLRSAA